MRIKNLIPKEENGDGTGLGWIVTMPDGSKQKVEVWSDETITLEGELCKLFYKQWCSSLTYLKEQGSIEIYEENECGAE